MLLRRITQHVKDQNWFAVGIDFVIVVIGVGVALFGQQWLNNGQARADLRVAEASLQGDLYGNYTNAKERLAFVECRKKAYRAISAQLLESGESWTPITVINDDGAFRTVLPNLLRSSSRNWGSRNWEAGLARGTFNQMDEDRRGQLDAIFNQSLRAEGLQDDIFALQGRMKRLAATTTITPDDRSRYYDVLGELDSKSGLLEVMASQIIARIETIGIDVPPESTEVPFEELSARNALGSERYGECYVPMEWPIFDKYKDAEANQ